VATTTEPQARRLVEDLALALQGALLTRHAPNTVADAFIATRLSAEPWRTYGAFEATIDERAIIQRAMLN